MSPSAFNLVLIGSTMVDAVVVGVALFGNRLAISTASVNEWSEDEQASPGRPVRPLHDCRGSDPSRPKVTITVSRQLSAILVTGLVFVVKAAALWFAGVGRFGMMHLVYIDLVVLIPLAGLAVLLASSLCWRGVPLRRATRPACVVACGAMGMALVGIYATYIERFRLQLETAQVIVPPEREGVDPIRIGVLADLQTDRVTHYEQAAVDRLMALKPDVILMPGDLYHGTKMGLKRELPALRKLLSRLSAPAGVYFVPGNCESPELAEFLLSGTGVTLLVNEIKSITVGDRRITIGGVELRSTSAAKDTIRQLETHADDGDIRIVIAHSPDYIFGLHHNSRIDLLVAGHTHGGQVKLPILGPVITASGVPRHVAAGGLHELDGRRVYVSRGVGCERRQAPRIRFLCPPEITLLVVENGE